MKKHDTILTITKFAFKTTLQQIQNFIKEERDAGKSDTEIINIILEKKMK